MERLARAPRRPPSDAEADRKRTQHATLADHLKDVADRLKASRPDSFIVRSGWTRLG